jgi:hypothetical protein
VPLLPRDLLQPDGELSSDLFPGEQPDALAERLAAYLDQAYATTADLNATLADRAAAAFAYARAWGAVFMRLNAQPVTASFEGGGSHGYAPAQIAHALRERDRWDAAYHAVLASAAVAAPVEYPRAPSAQRAHFRLF